MGRTQLDTYLSVHVGCSGIPIASDDDSGTGLASIVVVEVVNDGLFDVQVSQVDGAYEIGDQYEIRVADVTDLIFADGFEIGGATSWAGMVP